MWTFDDDDDEDVAAAERARRIINEMRSEGCPEFIWVVINEALLLLIADQSGDGSKRIEQHGKAMGMLKAGLLAIVPLQDEAARRRYIADIDAEAERFLFNSR